MKTKPVPQFKLICVRAGAIIRDASDLLVTLALEHKDVPRAKECVTSIEMHLKSIRENWPKQ